jgi:hypothetical protein
MERSTLALDTHTLWWLAYRAARSSYGRLFFEAHPEHAGIYRLACQAITTR